MKSTEKRRMKGRNGDRRNVGEKAKFVDVSVEWQSDITVHYAVRRSKIKLVVVVVQRNKVLEDKL